VGVVFALSGHAGTKTTTKGDEQMMTITLNNTYTRGSETRSALDLADAREIWEDYRDGNNPDGAFIGASDLEMENGNVYEDGKLVARISYNGRIWTKNGTEIKLDPKEGQIVRLDQYGAVFKKVTGVLFECPLTPDGTHTRNSASGQRNWAEVTDTTETPYLYKDFDHASATQGRRMANPAPDLEPGPDPVVAAIKAHAIEEHLLVASETIKKLCNLLETMQPGMPDNTKALLSNLLANSRSVADRSQQTLTS
jgi:hypothetical protein